MRSPMTAGRFGLPVLLISMLAMLAAGAATAADEIGIYFDESYTETNGVPSLTPGPLTGYLVLKDPTASGGVAGWECWLQIDGPAILVSADLAGEAINVVTAPQFMVGIGDAPLPGGSEVLLATFEFFVSEEMPVSLGLAPIYQASIPGEISYLNADGMTEIIPMNTVTGHPEVATIHGETPICTPTLEAMPMGETYVGGVIERDLGISNDGLVPLLLDIELVGAGPEFSVPVGGGPVTVDPGVMHIVRVRFEPSAIAYFECELQLGSTCPPIPVSGSGRAPIVAWDGATSLDFGEVPVGGSEARVFRIENTGEVAFEMNWSPAMAGCAGFVFDPDYAPATTLDVGESFLATIWFMPTELGATSCTVGLGATLPPLELTGSGREAITGVEISPAALVFPETAVGATYTAALQVTNIGELMLELTPGLADPDAGFTYEGGNYAFDCPCIAPNTTATLYFAFSPLTIGPAATQILLGAGIAPIDISGTGGEAAPGCLLFPSELTFGPIGVGARETKYFRVTNNGNLPLTITPSEDSPHFYVSSTTYTLQPGDSRSFAVYFQPQNIGVWECEIDLGSEFCGPIHCIGDAIWTPSTDENIVGFFFDEDFLMYDIEAAPYSLVPVYLALLECSSELGVGGWECRAGIQGDGVFVNWDLEGLALNIHEPPDFLVGTGQPLPYAPGGILLATAQIILVGTNEVVLTLEPLPAPSLEGEMAWLTGDNSQIWPMRTPWGVPECARINDGSPVAVTARTPMAEVVDGRVVLNWPRPSSGDFDGCRVLRRTADGEPQAISEELVPIDGETITYVDEPRGLSNGTVLYYSYALVADGREIARSPEAAVELQGLPAYVTRLLPNVPNPFNPQTEIRFELDADGPARVTIYDVTGRLVRVLVDEGMSAGPQSRIWNGTDDGGRRVSSGAYYVRLETDGRVDHRKVMLLK